MSEVDAADVSRKLRAALDGLRWSPSNENESVSLNTQSSCTLTHPLIFLGT